MDLLFYDCGVQVELSIPIKDCSQMVISSDKASPFCCILVLPALHLILMGANFDGGKCEQGCIWIFCAPPRLANVSRVYVYLQGKTSVPISTFILVGLLPFDFTE